MVLIWIHIFLFVRLNKTKTYSCNICRAPLFFIPSCLCPFRSLISLTSYRLSDACMANFWQLAYDIFARWCLFLIDSLIFSHNFLHSHLSTSTFVISWGLSKYNAKLSESNKEWIKIRTFRGAYLSHSSTDQRRLSWFQ